MWSFVDFLFSDVLLAGFFKMGWLFDLVRDAAYWMWNQVIDLFAVFILEISANMPGMDWIGEGLNALGPAPLHVFNFIVWIIPVPVFWICMSAIAANYIVFFSGSWALRLAKIIR